MPDRPNESTQRMAELVASTYRELLERLVVNVSDQDQIAIHTAIQKAAKGGYRVGVIEFVGEHEMISDTGQKTTLNIPEPHMPSDYDLWAEMFGADAPDLDKPANP